MNNFHLPLMLGTIGLLAACATPQNTQSSDAAIVLPSSAEVGVATSTVVPASNKVASSKSANTQVVEIDGDRLICKRTHVTGSRFAKKVCLSQARWREQQALAKKTASDLQNRGGRTNQPRSN